MIKEIIAHCMHYAGNTENFLTSIKKNWLIGKKKLSRFNSLSFIALVRNISYQKAETTENPAG